MIVIIKMESGKDWQIFFWGLCRRPKRKTNLGYAENTFLKKCSHVQIQVGASIRTGDWWSEKFPPAS